MDRKGKLKLEIEALAVETFDTVPEERDERGTVHAHAPLTDPRVCATPDCNTDNRYSCLETYCGACTYWGPCPADKTVYC